MDIAHDQHAPVNTNVGGGNVTVTFSSQPVGGSSVLVFCWFSTNGAVDPTVSDNASPPNTYTKIVGNNPGTGTFSVYIFKADNVKQPSSGILAPAVSSAHFQAVAFADSYLGMALGPADQTATASTGAGVSTANISATPTRENEMVAAAIVVDTGSTVSAMTFSPGTRRDGWDNDTTALTGEGGDNGTGGGLPATVQTETFSWTGSSNSSARMCIATFLPLLMPAAAVQPGLTWQRYYWKGRTHPFLVATPAPPPAPPVAPIYGYGSN